MPSRVAVQLRKAAETAEEPARSIFLNTSEQLIQLAVDFNNRLQVIIGEAELMLIEAYKRERSGS